MMMAVMMGELYQAPKEGGISDKQAHKAASEVADYIKPIADIRSDLAVQRTMLAAVLALVVAMSVRTFFT